jgi:CheY-like chemotaxis protein
MGLRGTWGFSMSGPDPDASSIRRRDRIGPSSNEEPDPEQELPLSPQAMRRGDPFMRLNIGLRGVDAKGGDPRRSKPQNALMDIMMPQIDAYQGGAIARSPCFGWLPIIVPAAKAMKDGREKCRGAGASGRLVRPDDTGQLLPAVRRWLHR